MNIEDLAQVGWLEPWQSVKPGLESELAREVGSQHPLHNRRAIAVARRHDCDDVLFFLPDGPSFLAVVHLSWHGREQNPQWPWTEFYSSLEDWVKKRMEPDHAEIGEQGQKS